MAMQLEGYRRLLLYTNKVIQVSQWGRGMAGWGLGLGGQKNIVNFIIFWRVLQRGQSLNNIGMYGMHLSSNSESEDENFEGYYKKVNYQGNLSDSEHADSQLEESASEESNQQMQLVRKATANRSSDPLEKSKIIKKNCESAKMSRQRKKVYLELLEQKAQQLTLQIYNRKSNIRAISAKVLQKFSRSNSEKHAFLVKKIALSKRLLAMTEEIQQLRKGSEDRDAHPAAREEAAHPELEKNLSPDTLVSLNATVNANQQFKGKPKRKKGEDPKSGNNKTDLEEKIAEKESYLQLGINAFMYEFGVRGSLRTDVLQRTKNEWFQSIQKSAHSPEAMAVCMKRMTQLLQSLEERTKKMDYCLRELKRRVKQRFVVQFLLDRQFFIHNSADTIYKKTQLTPSQEG